MTKAHIYGYDILNWKNEQRTKFQNDCNILKTVCIYETCCVSGESDCSEGISRDF